MKLLKNLGLLFASLSLVHVAQATSPVPPIDANSDRAVNISFFGGITGFDQNAYKTVKAAMAMLIVEGVVDHYVTTSWGMEGGSSFCVELSKDLNITADRVTHLLRTIKPADQSIYKYSVAKNCTKEN